MPLGYALLMCSFILYIFEIELKRIELIHSDNDQAFYNAIKTCSFQKWLSLLAVFVLLLLLIVLNQDIKEMSMYFSYSSTVLKLFTDPLIYFILIRAIKLIYSKYLERNQPSSKILYIWIIIFMSILETLFTALGRLIPSTWKH